MTRTILFENDSVTMPATVTLSDEINKYDELVIVSIVNGGYAETSTYVTSTIPLDTLIGTGDDVVHMWYYITDYSTLTLSVNTYPAGSKLAYVIGIKW